RAFGRNADANRISTREWVVVFTTKSIKEKFRIYLCAVSKRQGVSVIDKRLEVRDGNAATFNKADHKAASAIQFHPVNVRRGKGEFCRIAFRKRVIDRGVGCWFCQNDVVGCHSLTSP